MKTIQLVLLAAVVFATAPSISHAQTHIRVPEDELTVDEAMAVADPGDFIDITEAKSYVPFNVTEEVTVTNTSGGIVTIEATTSWAVQISNSDPDIEVIGITFVGGTGSAIAYASGGEFINCTFDDDGHSYSSGAVQLYNGYLVGARLTNCTIASSATSYAQAVRLIGDGTRMDGCTITSDYDNANGDLPIVELVGSGTQVTNCTISVNDSTSNAVCILATGGSCLVQGNTVFGGVRGIQTGGGAGSVLDNVVHVLATSFGIRAASSGSTAFYNNTVLASSCSTGVGIYLIGSGATHDIQNNLFVNMNYGIYANGGSSSASFDHNIWWSGCGSSTNLSLSGTQLANKEVLFCSAREGSVQKFTQRIDSEAAPGNNGWNELVGAKDVECAWGALERNTTVRAASVITILEDVTVPNGTSLTLNPEVEFRFDDFDDSEDGTNDELNELIVEGALTVAGSGGNEVRFISAEASPAEGDWYGIDASVATALDIDYAEIKHAVYGARTRTGDAGTNSISNSLLSLNQTYDILLGSSGTNATPAITDNTLTVGGGTGIYFSTGTFGSGTTVSGNTITGNSASADGIFLGQSSGSSGSITGNTITALSTGDAIHLVNGGLPITQNSLYSNLYGVHVTNGSGTRTIGTTTANSGNSIVGNGYGIFVDVVACTLGAVKVRRNYIASNSSTGVFVDETNLPDLGTSGEYGNNRIEGNYTASIWNSSSCGAIPAKGNYFNHCGSGTEVIGSVDTANRLCSTPFDPFSRGVGGVEPTPPQAPLVLAGVHPNPTSGPTTVRIALAASVSRLQVEVFDVTGRLIKRLASDSFQAGSHEFEWDGRGDDGAQAPAGVYFVRGSINDQRRESARILVVR